MRTVGRLGGIVAVLATGAALVIAAVAPSADSVAALGRPIAPQHVAWQRIARAQPGHAPVPTAGRAVDTSRSDHVIGRGTATSCTSSAVVKAVAAGGVITFDCGPKDVTIVMKHTAKVRNSSKTVVLDGGGKVTLSGAGARRILYMDTCDPSQGPPVDDCYTANYPNLVVQNITLRDGYTAQKVSPDRQYPSGGGAIFSLGGSLKVVNSTFIHNGCYKVGPDLGGGAIRAIVLYGQPPVYITKDTFRDGYCSNGSALSSIATSWVVTNSVFTDNDAIGHGQNPAEAGTPGGGSGGAIYMDGNAIALTVNGSTMTDNDANEGGGAIFFVSDNNTGTLTIANSTLHHNVSGTFYTQPYVGVFYHSSGAPTITNSTLN